MRQPQIVAVLFVGAALAACADTPARIDVVAGSVAVTDALAAPVLDAAPIPLRADVVGRSGAPLSGAALSWSVVPEGMASVGEDGLRCLRTGDATVTATGEGLSQSFTVRCRPVAKIQAPPSFTLVVGDPVSPLEAVALDLQGAPLADVPVASEIAEPATAAIVGGALSGLVVGTTTLKLTAGASALAVPVTVTARIQTMTLNLEDGHSYAVTLQPGRYVVEVHVKAADGSDKGVTVGSTGGEAGGCAPQPEATDHTITCTVKTPTTVSVTNPSVLRLGPAELGNLSVYQVP